MITLGPGPPPISPSLPVCTSSQPAPGDTVGAFPGVRGAGGGPFLEAHLQACPPPPAPPFPGTGHCGHSVPRQHRACIKQTLSSLSCGGPSSVTEHLAGHRRAARVHGEQRGPGAGPANKHGRQARGALRPHFCPKPPPLPVPGPAPPSCAGGTQEGVGGSVQTPGALGEAGRGFPRFAETHLPGEEAGAGGAGAGARREGVVD